MRWRALKLGERMNRHCATDACPQVPVEHFEHGGVGSDYCMDCADLIKAQMAMADYEKNGGTSLEDLKREFDMK